MDGSDRRSERREVYERVAWALPVLAALLLVTGLAGVGREMILIGRISEYTTSGWFILLINAAIVLISAASLLLFWRARKP